MNPQVGHFFPEPETDETLPVDAVPGPPGKPPSNRSANENPVGSVTPRSLAQLSQRQTFFICPSTSWVRKTVALDSQKSHFIGGVFYLYYHLKQWECQCSLQAHGKP